MALNMVASSADHSFMSVATLFAGRVFAGGGPLSNRTAESEVRSATGPTLPMPKELCPTPLRAHWLRVVENGNPMLVCLETRSRYIQCDIRTAGTTLARGKAHQDSCGVAIRP